MNELHADTLRPLRNPAIRVDLHSLLVKAIEHELEARCGGNPVLNRLEAEAQLERFLSIGRASTGHSSDSRTEENADETRLSTHRRV